MPKKKKQKRNLQQKLALEINSYNKLPKLSIHDLAAKKEADRLAGIYRSIERGETTSEFFFNGTFNEFARLFNIEVSNTHYKGILARVLGEAKKYWDCTGFAFLFSNSRVTYSPPNLKLPGWLKQADPDNCNRLIKAQKSMQELLTYGYEVSALLTIDAVSDQLVVIYHDVGDKQLLPGDATSTTYTTALTMRLYEMAEFKIVINPTFSYRILVDRAIKNYNRLNSHNYIRNPKSLEYDFIYRLVNNFVRHECSNYDAGWQSFSVQSESLHEVFRHRFHKAISAAYPELETYLKNYLAFAGAKAA